jgi:FkbM family methyltransferase
MNKTTIYLLYLYEYLRHFDFGSVVASIRFVLSGKSHSNNRIIRTSIGKFACRKNTNDFQFANYFYEWSVKSYFINKLNHCDVFIDVGACIGDYSILAAKKGLRCFAFEPVKASFEALQTNIRLNHLEEKIVAFPFGLSNSNEPIPFTLNNSNTGASHKSKSGDSVDCSVEMRTFDSVFHDLSISETDRVLIKLDVEGMEPEAIKGSANFLKTHPSHTLIIEDKHSTVVSIIKSLGKPGSYNFGKIDEFNIFAEKLLN